MRKAKNSKHLATGVSAEELCGLWQQDYVLAAYHILGVELPIAQRVILRTWRQASFMMIIASRGMGKSFNMAAGACLSACLNTDLRIGIIAPSYRQAKMIFDRILRFWLKSPIFQDQCEKRPTFGMDMCYVPFKNGSRIEAIPLGSGDTIRGARYQEVIVDEWIHVPPAIMDEVVLPMLNVPKDPILQLKLGKDAYERYKRGEEPFADQDVGQVNKMIMASTAYYKFHPSYEIYEKWKALSKEDPRYQVLTMNYTSFPVYTFCNACGYATDIYPPLNHDGNLGCPQCNANEHKLRFQSYMDIGTIHHQLHNVPTESFMCENLSIWVDDSGGFFRASHIRNCTVDHGQSGAFYPQIAAVPGSKYVLGIDPGRERSNFAMTILEVGRYLSKIVWCKGVGKEEFSRPDAYGEMVDLIRDLHRKFRFSAIGIDKGGGGSAIRDLLLRDSTYVNNSGELVIEHGLLEVLGNNPVHDKLANGERIIHMINFTNQWINTTAQSLRHALESKEVLFPTTPQMAKWDEELDDIHAEIRAMADELVSIKTTVLPKLDAYLKFEAQTSTSKTDRAMSFLISHYVASLVREKEIIKEGKSDLATGGIVGPATVSDIISDDSLAMFGGQARLSDFLRHRKGGRAVNNSVLAAAALVDDDGDIGY